MLKVRPTPQRPGRRSGPRQKHPDNTLLQSVVQNILFNGVPSSIIESHLPALLRHEYRAGDVIFDEYLDYVMPERFALEYTGADGQKHRPVIIHPAPFGSLERFIGILIEHYAGAFPLWLAPVQAAILPITDAQMEYARDIQRMFSEGGVRCEVDARNEKVNHKIRDWELKKVPFMLILGEKERSTGTVAVRQHTKGDRGQRNAKEFLAKLQALNVSKALTLEEV